MNENMRKDFLVSAEVTLQENGHLGPNEYQACVLETESRIGELHLTEQQTRILHAAIGIATEAGELLDQLKKAFFYKKPLDVVNLIEEMGDALWYIAQGLDSCDASIPKCMTANIKKLRKRYKEKFTQQEALKRDLVAERKSLEAF